MGFIPKTTCRRCFREYSGLRSRCPYCGTKKVKDSTRTPASTDSTVRGTAANSRAAANAKWQMIFGAIILAVVILAVIVLISVSINGDSGEGGGGTATASPSLTPQTTLTPTPTLTPSPTPTVSVTSITIIWSVDGQPRTEFAISAGSGIQMAATVYPLEVEADVVWSSSNEGIMTVDQTGYVTGVSTGSATLYAECGGVQAACTVYVTG